MDLDSIDRIFVISIVEATERQEIFKKRFPELVKNPKFEWFIVERDNEDTTRGCYESHQKVLYLSKERGYSKVLVFEDDVDLLVPWNEFVSRVNLIDYPDDWRIVAVGYFPFITKAYSSSLYKIIYSVGCHGYIINVKTLEIEKYTPGMDIDVYLFGGKKNIQATFSKIKTEDVYGIYPVLVRQRAKKSTISVIHDLAGNIELNRDVIVLISSKCNLLILLSYTIIVGLFILFGLISLAIPPDKKPAYNYVYLFLVFVFIIISIHAICDKYKHYRD